MSDISVARVRARAHRIMPSLARIAIRVREKRLESLGEVELRALKAEVDAAIEARKRAELDTASADLRRQAESLGVTPAEIAAFAMDRRRRPTLSA